MPATLAAPPICDLCTREVDTGILDILKRVQLQTTGNRSQRLWVQTHTHAHARTRAQEAEEHTSVLESPFLADCASAHLLSVRSTTARCHARNTWSDCEVTSSPKRAHTCCFSTRWKPEVISHAVGRGAWPRCRCPMERELEDVDIRGGHQVGIGQHASMLTPVATAKFPSRLAPWVHNTHTSTISQPCEEVLNVAGIVPWPPTFRPGHLHTHSFSPPDSIVQTLHQVNTNPLASRREYNTRQRVTPSKPSPRIIFLIYQVETGWIASRAPLPPRGGVPPAICHSELASVQHE